jgi:hypothetical protein
MQKKKKAEAAEVRKMSEEELLKKFDTYANSIPITRNAGPSDEILGLRRWCRTKCGFKGCKESTTVLGRLCPHCRLKFCFSHR